MRVIDLPLGANRRDICPLQLEEFFAEGLMQKEIAFRLRMDKSYFSAKINQSLELMQSRTRGMRRFQNKQKAA